MEEKACAFFLSWTGTWVDQTDQHRFGIVILLKKLWGGLWQLMEEEEGRGWRGRRRRAWRGRVPDTESECGNDFKIPPSEAPGDPSRGAWGHSCPKAQIKPPEASNANMKSLTSRGAWGFDCSPLRVPNAVIHGLCTKSGVAGGNFPREDCEAEAFVIVCDLAWEIT